MLRLLRSERGDVNWTPIYLLILAAIAAILLISVIKPLFQSALSTASAAKT
jgi:hypothetical protein